MPCHSPRVGYRGIRSADRRVFFTKPRNLDCEQIEVPCRQCVSCRLTSAKHWATRMMMEAMLHPFGTCWFLTLTYAPEHLPPGGSLDPEAVSLFMKRLRFYFPDQRLRFFAVGEYGEDGLRPHYHIIIFGLDLDDLEPAENSKSGHAQFTSASLARVWCFGLHTLSRFDGKAAAYCARYSLKKVNGPLVEPTYRRERIDPETGETVSWQVEPVFQRMSLRPGIGHGFFERFPGDLFPSGFVTFDGRKRPVPPYFLERLRRADRDAHSDYTEGVSERAEAHRRAYPEEYSEARRVTKRESARLGVERLKREL